MQIIISPAKKMRPDTDTLPWNRLPRFISEAETLYNILCAMSYVELKALWKCSDGITKQNIARLQLQDLRTDLTPAILAYEGIQYQYMAPGVFTEAEFSYVQKHLWILSGLYGALRPFDGVTPYRLEMQAKLKTNKGKDLYEYWGAEIAACIWRETDCVVNLASKEYSLLISRYRPLSASLITCVFGEEQNGRIVEKGTLCKMARGEMVRYLAEHQIDIPEKLQSFSGLNFYYSPVHSDASTYVFLRRV